MAGRSQVGLVATAAVSDYQTGRIRRHEHTRADKEEERRLHIETVKAQTGPVFLTYRDQSEIDRLIQTAMTTPPLYDFVADDAIQHTLWKMADPVWQRAITEEFQKLPRAYVADGHHRSAAALKVALARQTQNPGHTGQEEYNFFLAVFFPASQVKIFDYNRVVRDLNGLSPVEFLERVLLKFELEPWPGAEPYRPQQLHTFGLYLDRQWYRMTARPELWQKATPLEQLDVSILQGHLLTPILGINDPRTDKRIDFVGGIRGLHELAQRVDSRDWAVAIALYPTALTDLMVIADANEVMPPKSTWFEPKLRSGLVVHPIS
jgi:uncharacterized protein (DUF1015 family)